MIPTMYSLFSNYKFIEVYPTVQDFKAEYQKIGLTKVLTDEYMTNLYILLCSRWGEAHISNNSVYNFKQQVCSTIYMYGPAWQKRLQLQKNLVGLNLSDIQVGDTKIYNHSYNPSTQPTTQYLNQLPTINEKNTAKIKKGKVQAIRDLWMMIQTDVTKEFIDRFEHLFIPIMALQRPALYDVEELIQNLGE